MRERKAYRKKFSSWWFENEALKERENKNRRKILTIKK